MLLAAILKRKTETKTNHEDNCIILQGADLRLSGHIGFVLCDTMQLS